MREKKEFAKLPVLLHTSLDGKATKEAAQKVGANGYVVKNDIVNIIQYLNDLISDTSTAIGA